MRKILSIAGLILMTSTLMAQQPSGNQPPHASVTPLTSKDLPDFPGKEVLMITVEYPPGSSDPIHRHNAHAFVYVLEGLDNHAGERWKRSDADTGPNFL